MIDEGSNLFLKFLYEAPGEDPPDISSDTTDESPDTGGGDDLGGDDGPPDLDIGDESPPDLDGDDFGDDSFGGDEFSDEEQPEDLGLDEKVSAILNAQLYQRFLTLKSQVTSQISMLKNNSDVLKSISSDIDDELLTSLKKLDENIHLYLKNYFLNENYSKNLLFFNKCLNLLKILNDTFNQNVKKGLKNIQ